MVDLPPDLRVELSRMLTVDELPSRGEIEERCAEIARLARTKPTVMIGGAPWLMGPLVKALREAGVVQLYTLFCTCAIYFIRVFPYKIICTKSKNNA